MPDHSGAFLAAGRIIASAGANITRVSYNMALDTHTLFIDASGTQAQLESVTEQLKAIGYNAHRGALHPTAHGMPARDRRTAGRSVQTICPLGHLDFCGKRLDVYRGNAGHAVGEVVIVDEAEKLVFSGDILVNVAGFTKPQDEYNRLARYMLRSVNINSALASKERKQMLGMFDPAEYSYCCGHGAILRPGEKAR